MEDLSQDHFTKPLRRNNNFSFPSQIAESSNRDRDPVLPYNSEEESLPQNPVCTSIPIAVRPAQDSTSRKVNQINDSVEVPIQKQTSDSESFSIAYVVHPKLKITTEEARSHSQQSECNTSVVLGSFSGAGRKPSVEEQSGSSYASEQIALPFIEPVFQDIPQTNHQRTEIQDGYRQSSFQPITPDNGIPKPCIRPVLANKEIQCQDNQGNFQQESSTYRNGEFIGYQPLQTEPPREITLQPSALSRVLYKPTYRCLTPDQTIHTPPPSYQESLAYPVVQHQSLPDYSSVAAGSTNLKEPVVSIIRLGGNTHSRPHTSLANGGSRDNFFLWRSSSEEACNNTRSEYAQDQYSDHQILAMLACVIFWPVGLVAIYYANMANILQSEGVYAKSVAYSKRALKLSLLAFMIGSGVYLIFYLHNHDRY